MRRPWLRSRSKRHSRGRVHGWPHWGSSILCARGCHGCGGRCCRAADVNVLGHRFCCSKRHSHCGVHRGLCRGHDGLCGRDAHGGSRRRDNAAGVLGHSLWHSKRHHHGGITHELLCGVSTGLCSRHKTRPSRRRSRRSVHAWLSGLRTRDVRRCCGVHCAWRLRHHRTRRPATRRVGRPVAGLPTLHVVARLLRQCCSNLCLHRL